MNSYAVKPNQSLFDVAIEVYGDVQGVVWLIQDNRSLFGATDPLSVGQKLQLRDATVNGRVVGYLADFAPFQTIDAVDVPQGIGYWKTEGYVVG